MQMRMWKLDQPMTELARDSDGDLLLFVHEGEGALFCDYGHLEYRDRQGREQLVQKREEEAGS